MGCIIQGSTVVRYEGALLHNSFRSWSYYSKSRINQGERSKRGSTEAECQIQSQDYIQI